MATCPIIMEGKMEAAGVALVRIRPDVIQVFGVVIIVLHFVR